jgi:hypothetical protein
MTKQERIDLVRVKLGHKLEFGEFDCNLLLAEMYEPDYFQLFRTRYTTFRGGLRVFKKELEFNNIREWLNYRNDYVEVPFLAAGVGDIILDGDHDVSFCLGRHVAHFDKSGIFRTSRLERFEKCRVFKKRI